MQCPGDRDPNNMTPFCIHVMQLQVRFHESCLADSKDCVIVVYEMSVPRFPLNQIFDNSVWLCGGKVCKQLHIADWFPLIPLVPRLQREPL
jgi:hypothetical protein